MNITCLVFAAALLVPPGPGEFSATVHLSFHELEFRDLAFSLSVGHGKSIAASTAALSLTTPLAKDATRLARAPEPGVEVRQDFLRTMAWKMAMISRASTRSGV
jgi:hypothetical protein